MLGLVNIWSTTAFNAMTSLSLIGHYSSYLLPISLIAIRRVGKMHIPFGPFRLGRWGLPINIMSICYSVVLLVFMVLLPYRLVTASNMNYAGVIFGTLLFAVLAVRLLYGRKNFKGLIREIMEEAHIH